MGIQPSVLMVRKIRSYFFKRWVLEIRQNNDIKRDTLNDHH